MDRWLWAFQSRNDKKTDGILKNAAGIIRITPKSERDKIEGTTYIEHNSEAHIKLIAAHNRLIGKLRYYHDYYVVLVHHVSYDAIENYDHFRLFSKTLGHSRLISEYISSTCTEDDGCPHAAYPVGIAIFKPPKTKADICYVDRVVVSSKALNAFLQEEITGFDYKPLALDKEQKLKFEALSGNKLRKVDSEWWELIPEVSDTICVYNGPSEICPRCNGWLRVHPGRIIALQESPDSKTLVPNKWKGYYPLKTFEHKDIQNPKWMMVNGKKHEIVHINNGVPIVSKKFLQTCKKYDLKGYYKRGKPMLKNDLDPIDHEERSRQWIKHDAV